MSPPDHRRDPRAEPDDPKPHQVERPFQREVPALTLSTTAAVLPSESQVRAIATPLPSVVDDDRGPKTPPPPDVHPETESAPEPEPDHERVGLVSRVGEEGAPMSSDQPSLAAVEHLLDQGQWQALHDLLGPSERAATLSPHFALVFALAQSETHPEDASRSVELAIRSAARAHGLPESSALVRVVAKRLLRKSPTHWGARPAPPKKVSIILVLLALTLGGGAGLWLSTTKIQIPLPGLFVR